LTYLSFASFNAPYKPVRLMYEEKQQVFNFDTAPYGPENTGSLSHIPNSNVT